jgi:FtsH-binding integral membrane protein
LFALMGLVIAGVVFIFIEPSKKVQRFKAAVAIGVFAILVMVDTNQIIMRDYGGDFITAAMDYYLDIINLVINLISYMSNSD